MSSLGVRAEPFSPWSCYLPRAFQAPLFQQHFLILRSATLVSILVSPSLYLSLSPLHSPCPKPILPSMGLYKHSVDLSFLGAEEFFLTNLIYIFIYLLTVLYSCLFLIMKETGCSSILVFFPQLPKYAFCFSVIF